MPKTDVFFYAEKDEASVLTWLEELKVSDPKAYAQCVVRIEQLAATGHELRRPAADYLRDGIHELRAKKGRVQYRILYFFHGRQVAILAHAIVKEDAAVPPIDINRAIARKEAFVRDPKRHTYMEAAGHEQEDHVTDE